MSQPSHDCVFDGTQLLVGKPHSQAMGWMMRNSEAGPAWRLRWMKPLMSELSPLGESDMATEAG